MLTRLIFTSSPNHEKSLLIARSLAEKHLAACVSILPGMRSLYWWDGKVQEDSEELLLIKTSKTVLDSALAEIKRLHPYDTPELIVIDPESVDEKYQRWLINATDGGSCAGQR